MCNYSDGQGNCPPSLSTKRILILSGLTVPPRQERREEANQLFMEDDWRDFILLAVVRSQWKEGKRRRSYISSLKEQTVTERWRDEKKIQDKEEMWCISFLRSISLPACFPFLPSMCSGLNPLNNIEESLLPVIKADGHTIDLCPGALQSLWTQHESNHVCSAPVRKLQNNQNRLSHYVTLNGSFYLFVWKRVSSGEFWYCWLS